MSQAISCSSSGSQIVLIQHLVSLISVSDRPVHRYFLNLCTGRSLTESDDTKCCINTIWPPEDEQDIALKHVHVQDCNKYIKVCASSWSWSKAKAYINLFFKWRFWIFTSCRAM